MFGFVETDKLKFSSTQKSKTKLKGGRGGQGGLKMDGMNRKQRCGHVSSALQPDPAPGRQAPELEHDSEDQEGVSN